MRCYKEESLSPDDPDFERFGFSLWPHKNKTKVTTVNGHIGCDLILYNAEQALPNKLCVGFLEVLGDWLLRLKHYTCISAAADRDASPAGLLC